MRLFLLGLLFWVFNSTHVLSQLPNIPNPFKKKNQPLVADTSDIGKVLQYLEERSPVSTSFDDALYESEIMKDFEPSTNQYQPLEIQPNAEKGGFRLNSGFYTMMAKSFCLKAGTYGPSSGDGHLYAPLAGRKREMVETILERYAKHPDIPQQKIQVLLWAIIARADLASLLKSEHFISLKKLFSIAELAKLFIIDKLDAEVDQKIALVDSKMPPLVKKALHAEQEIQNLLTNNPIYEKLEQVAVLAGIAPAEDMIRQVSRGRWSYHPDGYFVRFFPQGYKQTRIDVYVPNSTSVELDATGKQVVGHNARAQGESKEVVFNPAKMVAVPANRSSQRIGVSPVPSEPIQENYEIIFYSFNSGKEVPISKTDLRLDKSFAGHMYIGFAKNGSFEAVKGFSPRTHATPIDNGAVVDINTDESFLLGYHTRCFAIKVSKADYHKAISVTMQGYTVGTNDCVSYLDKVAELLGLVTPTFDPIVFPDSYMEYLQENNKTNGTTTHKLCNVKPIQHTPIPRDNGTTTTVKVAQTKNKHSGQLEIIENFIDNNIPILDTEHLDKRLESGYMYHMIKYGTFKKGAKLSCVVKIKNNGNEMLNIIRVDNGCPHCVFVSYPTEGIAPGETKEIKIGYDTNRIGPFYKGITLHTNEIPDTNSRHTFYIKGVVEE